MRKILASILLVLSSVVGIGLIGIEKAGAVQWCQHWVLPSQNLGITYDIWACLEDNNSRHVSVSIPEYGYGIAYEIWGNAPWWGPDYNNTSNWWQVNDVGTTANWQIRYCNSNNSISHHWPQLWYKNSSAYPTQTYQFKGLNSGFNGPGLPQYPIAWMNVNRQFAWFVTPEQINGYGQCFDVRLG